MDPVNVYTNVEEKQDRVLKSICAAITKPRFTTKQSMVFWLYLRFRQMLL